MATIEFEISVDDLLATPGAEDLNKILDDRLNEHMALDPQFKSLLATNISYSALSVASGTITIRATFTPLSRDGETDETD